MSFLRELTSRQSEQNSDALEGIYHYYIYSLKGTLSSGINTKENINSLNNII